MLPFVLPSLDFVLPRLLWCMELCVSVPARPSLSTGRTLIPSRGFWACCPQEGFYRACLRGTNQNRLSVIWFRYLSSGGQKADFITPGGFMMSNKADRRGDIQYGGKARVVTSAGSPLQKMDPHNIGSIQIK